MHKTCICPDCRSNQIGDTDCPARELWDEIKTALRIAADAIEIASDWHVPNVQVDPPAEWGLDAFGEDTGDGWCSTALLAKKLRRLAA